MSNEQHPARRQRHGQRPTEPLTDWPEDFGTDRAAEAAQPASTDLTPLDYRAQGREEVLAIILAENADDPLSECVGWSNPVGPDDEGGSYWKEDKLREMLHIGDSKHDAYDRAEAAYWDALGRADEAKRELLFAQQAPFYQPLHDFLKKHEAWDLMADLKRAALSRPAATSGDAPATASGDERAIFEAAMRAQDIAIPLYHDGSDMASTRHRWEGWQARAAVSAATKPTADLSKLTRYEPSAIAGMGEAVADMEEDANGDYVLLADVQSLLATKPAAQAVPEGWAVERVGEAMHIKRKDGQWTGFMPVNGPRDALTFEFLGAMLAAAPLSADAAQEQARNDALEAAARQVEKRFIGYRDDDADLREIAQSIRALKRPAAGAEGAE